MLRRAAIAVFTVSAVGLAACGDDGTGREATLSSRDPAASGGAAEATGDDAGLTATVQRATLFETRRALRLSVRNTGADDVVIGTVQLSSPWFEPVEPEARDTHLDAGGRPVYIPLRFGPAQCGDDDAGPTGSADAESTDTGSADAGSGEGEAELVATVDGEERRIAIEQMPEGLLTEMQAAECAAAGVLADVDVGLGDEWTDAGDRTLAGELTVAQRRPGVTAELDKLLGNVIFAVDAEADAAGDEPWLVVDDDQPTVGVPVTIRAARCDPHALIEYKRTFIFVAVVAVDGDEPVRVDIPAEDGARSALEDLLTSCLG